MNIKNYNVALHDFCLMALATFSVIFFMMAMCVALM
jgi:hypothetical protein